MLRSFRPLLSPYQGLASISGRAATMDMGLSRRRSKKRVAEEELLDTFVRGDRRAKVLNPRPALQEVDGWFFL